CNGCGACCKVLVLEQSPEEVRQMAALTRVLGIPSDHVFAAEHWHPLTRAEATALHPFYTSRLPADAQPYTCSRPGADGRCIALARRGATVIGIARGAENLARLQESARGLSGTVETAQADVSDAEAITATLRRLERAHGRVDVLVNNAGTGAYKPAVRTSAVEFESIMRTNYLGAVACALAVLPGMLGRRSGHIVNVSSPSAFSPPPGQ